MRPERRFDSRLLLERSLYGVGALLLASWLAAHLDAGIYQARHMHALGESEPLSAHAATVDRVAPRSVIGRIEIPRLGLSAVVTEGTDKITLLRAVGHLPGTALPGRPGNAVLAGHRDTFFRPLARIAENDTIHIATPRGSYAYRVVDTRIVPPSEAEVLSPSSSPMLTLVTCYPFRYIGPAPMRFVVQAEEVPTGASP